MSEASATALFFSEGVEGDVAEYIARWPIYAGASQNAFLDISQ